MIQQIIKLLVNLKMKVLINKLYTLLGWEISYIVTVYKLIIKQISNVKELKNV